VTDIINAWEKARHEQDEENSLPFVEPRVDNVMKLSIEKLVNEGAQGAAVGLDEERRGDLISGRVSRLKAALRNLREPTAVQSGAGQTVPASGGASAFFPLSPDVDAEDDSDLVNDFPTEDDDNITHDDAAPRQEVLPLSLAGRREKAKELVEKVGSFVPPALAYAAKDSAISASCSSTECDTFVSQVKTAAEAATKCRTDVLPL
jgi:hypothetical protein